MDAPAIRAHYLERLRSLYGLIRKLERIYPDFPDAPADRWRAAVRAVAERIRTAPDAELLAMGGSHLALRNLVAQEMGIVGADGQGGTYGNRVLDINWE